MDDKLIGLLLAICSSLLIGVSFVITKLGLQRCSSENGTPNTHTLACKITNHRPFSRNDRRVRLGFSSLPQKSHLVGGLGCHGGRGTTEFYR